MTMSFLLHDNTQRGGEIDFIEYGSGSSAERDEFPIIREKLKVPELRGNIERSRVMALLEKSRNQVPATLITGRAGTGKTALAAAFARTCDNASWYSVEAADAAWPVFSRYFSTSLSDGGVADPQAGSGTSLGGVTQGDIALFLLRHFFQGETSPKRASSLIVLDDIHHIFDAAWFEEFFYLLIHSLPADAHLLLLCRSKPPAPLWRMRSKQMLNVLDEKVIAFDSAETKELLKSRGISTAGAEKARRESFGRVSKLLQFTQ